MLISTEIHVALKKMMFDQETSSCPFAVTHTDGEWRRWAPHMDLSSWEVHFYVRRAILAVKSISRIDRGILWELPRGQRKDGGEIGERCCRWEGERFWKGIFTSISVQHEGGTFGGQRDILSLSGPLIKSHYLFLKSRVGWEKCSDSCTHKNSQKEIVHWRHLRILSVGLAYFL